MPPEQIPGLWLHQREAIARAKFTDCFALLLDPGTGKTRCVIEILLEKFRQNKGPLNTLILAPLVVVRQWEREFHKYSDIDKGLIVPFIGDGLQKWKEVQWIEESLKIRPKKFIVITNYETLYNTKVFEFFERFVEALICDESSRLKNPSAKRTKLAIKLADKCKCRYILSGTPVLNSQLDIFSQFRILDKGKTFGKNFYLFRAQYFYDKNATWKGGQNYFPDWIPKHDCSQKIQDAIRPLSFRVTKEEALDLPALVREEIFVELTQGQRKQYNSMKESLIAFLNDKACVAEMALTKCLRLQQMVSGFMKFDDDTEKSFDDFAKLSALKELLEDIAPNHKVIVWAIFKRNYEDIKKVCMDIFPPKVVDGKIIDGPPPYAELHGGIKDKDAEVRRFMTDNTVRILIANPQSGSLGVNLTAASYSIFYSRGFSLEADLQSMARNYRGGTMESLSYMGKDIKVTRIDLICSNTIDQIILDAIKKKLTTATEILSELKRGL